MGSFARSCVVRSSRNIVLACLSPGDQALLEPHVEPLSLDRGHVLVGPDDPLDAVFFPDTALLSIDEAVAPGRWVEIALVGREGMIGWPALLGSARSGHAAVVRMREGSVLRVALAPLRAACHRSPSLWNALLRFVHMVIVQMAYAISAHLQHPLEQRLARWVLMRHDRVGGDVLLVQHNEIADCLNVRRASITDRLHRLEGERLIRCNRGRVVVRDRPALERFAGCAYGGAEAQYRALIAPFGKSEPAPVILDA